MAQIFPEWANKLPLLILLGAAITAVAAVSFVWYFFSPLYTDAGYRPVQPVAFSHMDHVGDLGLDCRYCHNNVEVSPHANVPPTRTCMNCHNLILPESEKLLAVRESWGISQPIKWERVHKLPDYAYFDHAMHLHAGVGCASCHGNIARMPVVTQQEPLSMSWCLDCHKNPDQHLRPREELTNMDWTPPPGQSAFAQRLIEAKNIDPPLDCSGCHR